MKRFIPYWFTPLGLFNMLFLQWFLMRLAVARDTDTGKVLSMRLMVGVVPLTGWYTNFRFFKWYDVHMVASLLLAFVTAACTTILPDPKPDPRPIDPPVAKDACDAYCDLQTKLACSESPDSPGADETDGTADDVPCSVFCRDIVEQAGFEPDRACLDTAKTCEASEECMFGPASLESKRETPKDGPGDPLQGQEWAVGEVPPRPYRLPSTEPLKLCNRYLLRVHAKGPSGTRVLIARPPGARRNHARKRGKA